MSEGLQAVNKTPALLSLPRFPGVSCHITYHILLPIQRQGGGRFCAWWWHALIIQHSGRFLQVQSPAGYTLVLGQYTLNSKALSLEKGEKTPEGGREARTSTEVTKDVVALFREGDFVDGMADEASFQQVAGVLAGLPPVRESFHVVVQPVHHI